MKCLQCGRRILDVEAGCPDSYCKRSNISSPVPLPGARDRSGTYLIRGKTQRELIAERTRSLPKRNEWGPVKWFLFSMAISVVAGSTVALEYYRSFSPMEEIPNLVANLETVNPTGLNSVARIPGRGSELIPTPTPTPTNLTPTPALTDGEIFENNDNGEISDAEAKRLLSKVIYEGESEGQLADEVKGILERVCTEEGEGKKFFINLTQVPIDSTETNGFPRLKFQEPNKATFVMPDGPTEISGGLVYALSFVALATVLAENPNDISDNKFRSVFEYATNHEMNAMQADCHHLDSTYCALFIAHSRSPS